MCRPPFNTSASRAEYKGQIHSLVLQLKSRPLPLVLVINISVMSSSSPSSTPTIPSTEEVKDEVVAASKAAVSSFRSLAAGGVGGVCAVLVGHPFDLVKVRMQTAEKGVYTGALDVVKRTVAREGLRKVNEAYRISVQALLSRPNRVYMQVYPRRWWV